MPHSLHVQPCGRPTDDELVELAARWRRARRSALHGPGAAEAGLDEEATLQRLATDPAGLTSALRRTFDHSRRLGEGFARFRGAPVPPEVLPEVLSALGLPCLEGRWEAIEEEPGFRLQRPPCRASASAACCDHAREAVDGLVLGMTDGVLHARHESAGHGGARCVDVLYGDPQSSLRHGPVPAEHGPALALVQAEVARFKRGASLEILGVREGELHYELTDPASRRDGCGGCGDLLPRFAESSLLRHLPTLVPRELSPRPVLEPAATAPPLQPLQPLQQMRILP